uniref:Zinc finger CCCH domain-containing protein 13-like n=1 Tax=Nelumbo nucifera TaxID=4432 RepID=A0A822YXN1_NELNU|nr:TPA_asm: hypothetical protein HUJ06_006911 [Nelumbo nucifera]
MPRSSRHKSHRQHRHSSKDVREHSDSEEEMDSKDRKCREETAVRVSRDLASGEKRKLVSQSQDGKDVFGPGNGDLPEEFAGSKKRKDKADIAVTDRWNGGEDEQREDLIQEKELKGDVYGPDSEKGLKSKVLVDSKSKSSRRSECVNERKDDNVGLTGGNEEAKRSMSKVESKHKSEKDWGRKEVQQYKDARDKDRGAEKDRKIQDVRRERSVDTVPGKQEEERSVRREIENSEWQIQDELRNPELEKELEKRIKHRRDSSHDKNKYQEDSRDGNEKRLSSRDDRSKTGKYKDERNRDERHKDKYQEDTDRDHRYLDNKQMDERSSRDHMSSRSDSKHLRDETRSAESRHRKSKLQDIDDDGSPHRDSRGTRYKDEKGRKRSSDDNDDNSEFKSRSNKEHRSDLEKKSLSSSKGESPADGGRSQSRHTDVDSTVSNNRMRSPSSSHVSKDQDRHSSKHRNSRFRDYTSEERFRSNATSTIDVIGVSGAMVQASEFQCLEKTTQKEVNHLGEMSAERSPRSNVHATSPIELVEKSPSSTSIEQRYSNRTSVRRSLDVGETGWRSTSSRDAGDYSTNEDRGSREFPLEKPMVDDFSQADGDNVSVSSSFNRTGNLPSSSSSLPPPPPLRSGVDSPSLFGSSDEDGRGKSVSRFRRSNDPNTGRGQGNSWKGNPNWPSPVTNGFIPYQHGPPPGGFHAMMQQFPAPPIFGVRPSMELNHGSVHYHIPDADRFSGPGHPFAWRNPADESCPPHLHGWDGNNGVFGDDSHIYGRPEWDQNRHVMSGRGRDTGADMWKGQNGSMNMELPTASQEDYPVGAQVDEVWAGQSAQRSRNERNKPGPGAENIEIKQSSVTRQGKDISEAPPKTIHKKLIDSCKTSSDDGDHFCHIYLSKLDVSVELACPELYGQCMGVLTAQGNKTDDDNNVTNHVWNPKGIAEDGADICYTTSSDSFFPAINSSVFERAMVLYWRQSEEAKAKPHVSSHIDLEPKKMLASNGEKVEPVPTSNWDTKQEKADEAVPTSDPENMEPFPNPGDKKFELEQPVSTSPVDEAVETVPTPWGMRPGEPVSVAGNAESEEAVPPPSQKKIEVMASPNQEKLEVVGNHCSSLENASETSSNSTSSHGQTASNDNRKNGPASSATEKQAFGDIMCGPIVFSDDSDAALMPESIESGK